MSEPALYVIRGLQRAAGSPTTALRGGRDYGSERIITRVRDFRTIRPAPTGEARDLDDTLYDTEVP